MIKYFVFQDMQDNSRNQIVENRSKKVDINVKKDVILTDRKQALSR